MTEQQKRTAKIWKKVRRLWITRVKFVIEREWSSDWRFEGYRYCIYQDMTHGFIPLHYHQTELLALNSIRRKRFEYFQEMNRCRNKKVVRKYP